MKSTIPFIARLVAAFALPLSLCATPERPPAPPRTEIFAGASAQTSGDFGPHGSFRLITQQAGARHQIVATRHDQLSAAFSVQRMDFNFSDTATLVPGLHQPFGTVWTQDVSLNWRRVWNGPWSTLLSTRLRDGREEGVSKAGITGGGTAAVIHDLNETVSTGFGVAVATRFARSPHIYPTPVLRLRLGEQWLLETQRGITLSRTSRDRATTLVLSGEYESTRFRIKGGDVAPGGTGHYKRIPLSMTLQHRLPNNLSLSAGIYAALDPSMKIQDRHGRTVRKDLNTGTLFGGTVQAAWRF